MMKRVTSIVISVHLFFILLLLFTPPCSMAPKTRHVKVRSIRPIASVQPVARSTSRPISPKNAAPPSKKPIANKKEPIPPSASKKKTSTSSPQKTAQKKNTPSKKPAVVEKGKPVKKPAAPAAKEVEWEQIDQALAKIEAKSYAKEKQSLDIPQPLTFLDVGAPTGFVEKGENVETILDGFLHDVLHFPDIGEVVVEVTVEKDGKISKMVMVQAESRRNKLYLQEALPHLQLPIQLDEQKTWTLRFANKI
jgi:outer membrane biosynthesis protein TonB